MTEKSGSLDVKNYVSCATSLTDYSIIRINVSGKKYQTYESTLQRYPDTLLGSPHTREPYYDITKGEYFFDRHRSCFTSILYYYQSEGTLIRPVNLSPDVFMQECCFFGIGEEAQKLLGFDEMEADELEDELPQNKYQRMLWEAFEMPTSSWVARILAIISLAVILISIVVFCIESLPTLKGMQVWFVISAVCNTWFTLEYLLRFAAAKNKLNFVKGTLNIVDVLSILPFYIDLITRSLNAKGGAVEVLRVLRVVRVVRIFKLTRHSRGLYILGHTLKSSRSELFMLLLFMIMGVILFASGVYYFENEKNYEQFPSIPHSFWWAIVTMTTVGYGDLSPMTPGGKFIGAMCGVSGVLAIALPVPVIVSNFEYYYKEELARQIAEQARQNRKAREEASNHLPVQMPLTLSSSNSNIDQEILELKGVKPAHSRQEVHGNHYSKLSPKTTPSTPRKSVETTI
ncbi:potassium voltage-gated channel subfamily A member 6-like [Dendronephthya gigantea]|uniref:potassium voltage-gated channel subfamily A member 6-like n=1 Tax=Dendronephthya gigantea TaxID=151771 RepID=UPI00106A6E98|nr:potassium voltage-gated channel subfamily A member 6-like [Dendronephthya gigantea]